MRNIIILGCILLLAGAGCSKTTTQTTDNPVQQQSQTKIGNDTVSSDSNNGEILPDGPTGGPTGKEKYLDLGIETPVLFSETPDKEQEAVFYMGTGWMGGMGGYPVLENPGDIKHVNNLPVFVQDEQAKNLIEKSGGLPTCYVGTPIIKIAADIVLKQETGKNYSIEEAPEQTYYQVTIKDVHNVFVKAEPCID